MTNKKSRLPKSKSNSLTKFRRLFLQALVGAAFATSLGSEALAQTTLSTGDVQILGVTSDAADSFSFVVWRDIGSGTVIRFMDHSFTNATTTINNSEDSMSLEFSSNLSAGTVIRVVDGAATLTNGSAFNGIKTGTLAGISVDGDQVFAFQGSAPSGTNFSGRTLLYGFNVANTSWLATGTADSNASYLPSSLNGINANFDSGNFDNVDYAGARTGMTTEAFRAAISNIVNYTQNNNRFDLTTTGFSRESSTNLFWDANGVTAGDGGSGTWDTTTQSRFKNATEGTTFLRWVNSSTGNDHTAVFGGTAGTVSVAAGGVTTSGLDFQTTGYAVNNNSITLVGTAPTINTAALVSASIGSVLAGSTGLTKTGAGTVTLSAENTYTGGTTVQAGTLQLSGGNNRLNTTGGISVTGGELNLGGNSQSTSGNVQLTGGAINNGTLNKSTGFFDVQSGSSNAVLAGSASLTKSGTGSVTLSGANTYSGGTTVSQGTLQLSGSGTLGANTNTLTVNGGTMDFNGQSRTIGSLGGTGGSITSSSAATLTVGNGDASGANASAITGDLSLVKNGIGTQTLSGANSYSGTTTINAGTLLVNGSHTGGGAYTVNAGGTLGGTGTVTANVNLVGGTLSAGNSIGAMTVNGNLTFDSSSKLFVEFNSSNLSADMLNVSGTVNLAGAFLDLNDLASAVTPIGSSFTFLTAASVNGQFSNFADGAVTNIGSNQWKITYGTGSISFASVPEPSSLALIGLLGLSGFTYRRFRSKKKQMPEVVA